MFHVTIDRPDGTASASFYSRYDATTAALSAACDFYPAARRCNPDAEYTLGYLHAVRDYWEGGREVVIHDPYGNLTIRISETH